MTRDGLHVVFSHTVHPKNDIGQPDPGGEVRVLFDIFDALVQLHHGAGKGANEASARLDAQRQAVRWVWENRHKTLSAGVNANALDRVFELIEIPVMPASGN